MEFRWVAIIALWTLLSGPVFDSSKASHRPDRPYEGKDVSAHPVQRQQQ